jgi:hypothetical protein
LKSQVTLCPAHLKALVNSFDRFMDELDMEPGYKGAATGMTGEMNQIFIFSQSLSRWRSFLYITLAAQLNRSSIRSQFDYLPAIPPAFLP